MFRSYLTVALRNIVKHKGYTLINVLGLAIGMACCTLILLYVQDELSFDRYHDRADRIYRVVNETVVGDNHTFSAQTAPPWGPALVKDYPEVVNMVRFKTPNSRWLIKHEEKEFWERGFFFADSTIFDVFSYSFVQGNPKTALNGPNSVVINVSTAKRYFGDEDPMGKVFNAEDFLMLTVTGIVEDMPINSHFHYDFLVSFSSLGPGPGANMYGNLYSPSFGQMGANTIIYTYILLAEGASAADLEAKLPSFIDGYLGDRLRQREIQFIPTLQPLTDIHLYSALEAEMESNGDIQYVYIFSALAFIILAIACINFMNLATARSANRAREVGMRKVVGANRSHLVWQFIGESMILAFISMLVSVGLCYLLLPAFNGLAGKTLVLDISDVRFITGLAAIVLLVGFLSGSYPAIFLSSFKPVAVLQGAMKAGAASTRLRQVLVVGQFSMAILMIVGTATVYSQLDYVRNRKLGFIKENVVMIRLANEFISQRYEESFRKAVVEHPDILGATGASSMPGGLINTIPIGEDNFLMQYIMADYDYMETMGMELVSGRKFSREFGTDERQAVILNETAVRELGLDDPLGQELKISGSNQPGPRVIGVAKDFHMKSLHQKIQPLALLATSRPANLWFGSIRIRGDNVQGAMAAIEAKWQEVLPDFPYEFTFLDNDYENLYKAEQQLERVFGTFATFAIFVTCLGLFGLASFMAEQRTREIGVRKVLGASVPDIVRLLSRNFTGLVIVAFLIATPLAYYAMNQWLASFAYHTELSLWNFVIAGAVAMVIAWLTVGYQALKAATANPVNSLRPQ